MTDYRDAAWALLIADGSSLEEVVHALARRSDEELVEECLRAWSDAVPEASRRNSPSLRR